MYNSFLRDTRRYVHTLAENLKNDQTPAAGPLVLTNVFDEFKQIIKNVQNLKTIEAERYEF